MIPALLSIDSYKLGHISQYPEGTEFVYSNMTPRSLKHFPTTPLLSSLNANSVVAFGMYNAISEIHKTFDTTFFKKEWNQVKEEFINIINTFTDINTFPIQAFKDLHDLGYLPLQFYALEEGTLSKVQIPVLTVENTNPKFDWLVNFIETWLSASLWKSMTSATIAQRYRLIFDYYGEKTGIDKSFIDFQGHDFSARGMSGIQDAAVTGSGHLIFFKGTDNIAATYHVKSTYDIYDNELIGASIPATEHSVMCLGMQDNELETIKRLITEVYPSGMVSIVSDTWDFWRTLTEYSVLLKDIIMNRDGKVVFRPDSGNPVDIICGTAIPLVTSELEYLWDMNDGIYTINNEYYEITNGNIHYIETPTSEMKGAVECLWDIFGGTTTNKGYRQLDSHVGLIYGDSITLDIAENILNKLANKNFASNNIVCGIGSFTYQYVTRDTLGTAMKATCGIVNGVPREIFKEPKTDLGKRSATGYLKVIRNSENELELIDRVSYNETLFGELKAIYSNGIFLNPKPKFSEIRQRSNQ